MGWGAVPIHSSSCHQEPPTPPNTPAEGTSRPGAPHPLNVVSWFYAPILESPTAPLVGRSPPAGGEPYKRMHHHWWSSRPEYALLGAKVSVGGHRLLTPRGKAYAFQGDRTAFLLLREPFPRTCGVEPPRIMVAPHILPFPHTGGAQVISMTPLSHMYGVKPSTSIGSASSASFPSGTWG